MIFFEIWEIGNLNLAIQQSNLVKENIFKSIMGILSSRMKLATSFWLFSCALKLTAKKFRFFFYPNNFNLKKPIYLLTHTSTHTKIHFLHIVRQFLEHACSIDIYKPYTNSNCITIDFEKNRISNVISFISL